MLICEYCVYIRVSCNERKEKLNHMSKSKDNISVEVNVNFKLIKCYAIILGLICLIPIAIYILNFKKHSLSDDPGDWGTFGDYLGGVLNPILAIIGLYITVALAYLSDKWNKTSILNQERTVRPVGRIVFGNYEDVIEVKIRNNGLGPMIISSMKVIKNGISKNTLIDWMPELPDDVSWTDYVGDISGFSLSPNQELNLIKFEVNEEYWKEEEFRDKLRNELSDIEIMIEYKDIYDKEMPELTRKLDWFKQKTELNKQSN